MPSGARRHAGLAAPAPARASLPAAFPTSRPSPFTTAMPGRVVAAILEAAQPLEEQAPPPAGARCSRRCRTSRHVPHCKSSRAAATSASASRVASGLRRSAGRSARCPMAGRAASGPRQDSRSPSRSSAAASAKRAPQPRRTADAGRRPADPWPSRWCTGATRRPAAKPVPQIAARRCKIKATPSGASRPMCSAGSITPPFPSPPISAPSSRWPGPRWPRPPARGRTVAPTARAASSTTRLVERFTTTGGGCSAALLRPSNTARTANASV